MSNKYNSDGNLEKRKARLVAKGFSQKPGIDYSETFAPTTKIKTIRTLITLAVHHGWEIFHLDIKSAFLHGDIGEEIYMRQPEGFIKDPTKVCKLKKALYGLKQAPRAWYEKLENHLITQGLTKSGADLNLFYLNEDNKRPVITAFHVDDIFLTGQNPRKIISFKGDLDDIFKVTDLGNARYYLGMQICRRGDSLILHQEAYIRKLLSNLKEDKSKGKKTPLDPGVNLFKDIEVKAKAETFRSLIGSLLYLTYTRPDIHFVVCYLSRFMQEPSENHLKAARNILRYVKETINLGLPYDKTSTLKLEAFCDANYADKGSDGKATTGFLITLGGNLVSWVSQK